MGVLKIKTGENTWETIDNLNLSYLSSTNSDNVNTSVEISNGNLLINGDNLADYLSENTSACKVGTADAPSGVGKIGDLYVQITSEGYSLLWYYSGTQWVRMNSIWG